MIRTALLAGAALALLGFAAPHASAQACTSGNDAGGDPTLTCTAAPSTIIDSALDSLSVIITPGASILSSNRANPPLRLGGNDQTVRNSGLLQNSDTRNNTNAIEGLGTGLTVENEGVIRSGDRAIHLLGGGGGFTLINKEDGQIFARRQAVRSENDLLLPNVTVENYGLIQSDDGRAVQMRGPGFTLMNFGTLRGGEEVVEARLGVDIVNHGLIALNGLEWDPVERKATDNGATEDEDGVQFASGTLNNHGVILGTDDGVDIDEGLIHNHRSGVIVSVSPGAGHGIDIDEYLQLGNESFNDIRPGPLTIVNEGLIRGPKAIAADEAADQELIVRNSGRLVGSSGLAIDLAANMGDTEITLFGESVVLGDIAFGGAGVNTLILGPFDAGARFAGEVRAKDIDLGLAQMRLDQGFGAVEGSLAYDPDRPADMMSTGYHVDLSALAIGDMLAFLLVEDLFRLDVRAGDAGRISFSFRNPTGFLFDGEKYGSRDFAAFLKESGVAPIPLPAAGWLLLAGLGALGALRRRAA